MTSAAYQPNAYQNNAYQTIAQSGAPAFYGCAFQFNAFQASECPVPPTPVYDGHDAGKKHKERLKKLQALEDARIEALRDQAEHRKMLIRHQIDPEAKAEYERKLAAQQVKPVEKAKEIVAKSTKQIDRQLAQLEKLAQQLELKSIITAELAKIHEARMAHEQEIARQIKQADEELALMMLM